MSYSLYSGNSLYLSKYACHSSSFFGAEKWINFQSTMDNPDSVNLVNPPNTMIPKTAALVPASQYPTIFLPPLPSAKSLDANPLVLEKVVAVAVVVDNLLLSPRNLVLLNKFPLNCRNNISQYFGVQGALALEISKL